MSDDWAICPKCGEFDAEFVALPDEEQDLVQCKKCGTIISASEIRWKHTDFGPDD